VLSASQRNESCSQQPREQIVDRTSGSAATCHSPTGRRTYFALDLLRGLAALSVVLYHANGMFWRTQLWDGGFPNAAGNVSWLCLVSQLLPGAGFLGVNLFFVLSGFCIHLPAANKTEPLNLPAFAVRRFFRLYPSYLAVVAGCFLMLGWSAGFGKPPVTWGNFLGHLVFWHYDPTAGGAGMGISPVLWTIALEVQFYLLYAVSLRWLRRVGIGQCALLALGAGLLYQCAWIATTHPTDWPAVLAPERFCLARFGEWLLGAWMAELCVLPDFPQSWKWPRLGSRLSLGAFIVTSSALVVAGAGLPRLWLNLPAAVGFALILLGVIEKELARPRPASLSRIQRLGQWLGERSYSLYLVHFTVMTAGISLFARYRGQSKSLLVGSPALAGAIAGSVLLTFVVTALCYRMLEAPSHRLARRLTQAKIARPKTKDTIDPSLSASASRANA